MRSSSALHRPCTSRLFRTDISRSREVEPATAGRPRRLASVLARAERRAESLAGSGRHTAAVRLLERAMRVLQGRDEGEQAAKCALGLAWILRSRGHVQAACAQAERVRTMTSDAGLHAAASSAIGILWTDEGRYAEAESALRAAAVAAAAVKRFDVKSRAELGLARALFWRRQHGEALAIVTALCDSALPDVVLRSAGAHRARTNRGWRRRQSLAACQPGAPDGSRDSCSKARRVGTSRHGSRIAVGRRQDRCRRPCGSRNPGGNRRAPAAYRAQTPSPVT